MNRKLDLKGLNFAHPDVQVEWDSENGTLTGPGAAHLQLLIDSVLEQGYMVGHPYPTSYSMTDPLRIPEEMATLLGMYWHLPDDMIPLIMPPPEDPDTEIPTLDGKPVELIY